MMRLFLGMVWGFARKVLPSANGRQRYNVLAVYEPSVARLSLWPTTSLSINGFLWIPQQNSGACADTGCPICLVRRKVVRRQQMPSATTPGDIVKVALSIFRRLTFLGRPPDKAVGNRSRITFHLRVFKSVG